MSSVKSSSWRRSRQDRVAFTLVELLVVIAIIGILIALLLPAVQAAREAARRAQCSNNLKQLALGLHNYHDISKCFPPAWIDTTLTAGDNSAAGNNNALGWGYFILPFIEQESLHDQIDANQNWQVGNDAEGRLVLNAFVCPSDAGGGTNSDKGGYGTSNYSANVQASVTGGPTQHALFGPAPGWGANVSRSMASIRDGTSNTIALV